MPMKADSDALLTFEQVGGADWPQIARHLIWSACMLATSYLVSKLLHPSVSGMSDLSPVKIWIRTYIGLLEEPPVNVKLDRIFTWIQFFFSIATVILWIYKTYAWTVSEAVYWLEFAMCVFYAFLYIIDQLRFQFDPGHVLGVKSVVDTFTIVPLLLQRGLGCGYICPAPCWLTVSYLRAYRVLEAWNVIEKSGPLSEVDEFHRSLVTVCVRCMVIVILFAATMFCFEVLGDIEGFVDQTVQTGFGETSFMVLCYYTFVTISTVGYGDFSPTTVLGRIFVIFVIVGGVVFFSVETNNMVRLLQLAKSGKGKFTPHNAKRKHVLVLGGGVTTGPLSVLESFLSSLVDSSHGDEVPEVLMMASKAPEDQLVALLEQQWATRAKIKYLFGNPTSSTDLERARISNVELCYVLADVSSDQPMQEDLQNIVRAAAIYRQYEIPMLVMILEAKNIRFAVQAGIPERMCAGLDDLELAALASSCQCVGLSTLLINLALPDLGSFEEEDCKGELWLIEYAKGANKELYGLQLNQSFNGMDFTKAAYDVYDSSGVMLIAAQDDNGMVVMNPGSKYTLRDNSVLFCIANDEDSLDAVRRDAGRVWLVAYEENRAAVAAKKDMQRRAKAASMDRPALLALSELNKFNSTDDTDGGEGKKTKAKNAGVKQSSVAAKGPGTVGPGILGKIPGGLGAGVRARMTGKESKKKEEKKKEEEEEEDGDLFDEEEKVVGEGDDKEKKEEELQRIVDDGDHIVVVGMGLQEGALVPQLTTIIRQLRTPILPESLLTVPIVILYDYEVKEKVQKYLATHKNLVYVKGSPLKLRSLLKVGVDRCSKMLIVSGGNGGHEQEPIMADQDVILLLSMLESQEALWGKLPTVICQLQVPSNIKQLSESLASEQAAAAAATPSTPRRGEGSTHGLVELDSKSAAAGSGIGQSTRSSRKTRTHLKYASGRIIHRAEFSSLFAAAYYTPGVLELLKSMCQPPQSASSSIVWQIPATNDMDGKKFKEVFEEMAKLDAIPMGLQRRPRKETGNALPIVYTCPDQESVIRKGDCLYVLASTEWLARNPKFTSKLQAPAVSAKPDRNSTALVLAGATAGGDGVTSDVGLLSDEETALKVQKADATGPTRCPSGHKLKLITTPEDGWGCDLCAVDGVAAGTAMHGCRKCKWVCCTTCFVASSGLEGERGLGGEGKPVGAAASQLRTSMSSRQQPESQEGKSPRASPRARNGDREAEEQDAAVEAQAPGEIFGSPASVNLEYVEPAEKDLGMEGTLPEGPQSGQSDGLLGGLGLGGLFGAK